ncbi:TlpA family protein disulfide reductase [Paraflavitalea soli]|uniref:TlpA family protein disulfide reductase n=1 Tax=Paraflavitalea soli TaxID=2315862 RepID=A0A3B7N314_9BACT|nr:TlpA disulfide reductase family protein [Paraflavitalea soli]AXY78455.1 TlpA family protein disulfide reductase [Paraflavitalea soli]
MKSTLLLCLLLGSLYGFAQKGAPPNPLALDDAGMDGYLKNRKPAKISIQVHHLPASAGRIKVSYSLVHFGAQSQIARQTVLGKDGTVTIVLDENLPYQQLWLTVDSLLYTGIVVNSDLHISIDAAITKGQEIYLAGNGVQFSGTDGALNSVLNEHTLFRKKERDSIESYFVNQSLLAANKKITLETFLQTADLAYRQLQQTDEEFIGKYPGYGEIIRNETNSMYYGWFCVPFTFKNIPAQYWERIKTHQPYFVSNDGVAFYQQLSNYIVYNSNNAAINIQSLLYKNYAKYNETQKSILDSINYYEQLSGPEREKSKKELNNLYNKRYSHFTDEQSMLTMQHQINIIENNHTGARADLLKICLMGGLKEQYNTTYPFLLKHLTTDWCKRIVQTQLAESISRQKEVDSLFNIAQKINDTQLYIGKPLVQLAFGAQLYRLDSLTKAADFIVNLKAKFKGKAIIIDFWATWCGPCLSDIPRGKKLHEDNKDLPIEYVYLCTTGGSNEKSWKNHVVDLKAPGTHIFVNDVMITEIKRIFNASGGFPAYVVIDLQGNASASKIRFMSEVTRATLQSVVGL